MFGFAIATPILLFVMLRVLGRRNLVENHVEMIEIPQRRGVVRKNAADIKMAVDAIELFVPVGDGPHEDVVQSSPLYRRMWETQQIGMDSPADDAELEVIHRELLSLTVQATSAIGGAVWQREAEGHFVLKPRNAKLWNETVIAWLDPSWFEPLTHHHFGRGILAACGTAWLVAAFWAHHIVGAEL